jgi:ketosteroid isomerase-like protein
MMDGTCDGEERKMSDERSRLDVLERMVDGFNAHDLDAIMALFSDDCAFESPRGPDPWGRRFEGPSAVREGLGARFATIPDVHYGDGSHFVAGERGVSEWTLTGTTTDGTELRVRGCDIWTFRGDEVVLKNSFWKIVEPQAL